MGSLSFVLGNDSGREQEEERRFFAFWTAGRLAGGLFLFLFSAAGLCGKVCDFVYGLCAFGNAFWDMGGKKEKTFLGGGRIYGSGFDVRWDVVAKYGFFRGFRRLLSVSGLWGGAAGGEDGKRGALAGFGRRSGVLGGHIVLFSLKKQAF